MSKPSNVCLHRTPSSDVSSVDVPNIGDNTQEGTEGFDRKKEKFKMEPQRVSIVLFDSFESLKQGHLYDRFFQFYRKIFSEPPWNQEYSDEQLVEIFRSFFYCNGKLLLFLYKNDVVGDEEIFAFIQYHDPTNDYDVVQNLMKNALILQLPTLLRLESDYDLNSMNLDIPTSITGNGSDSSNRREFVYVGEIAIDNAYRGRETILEVIQRWTELFLNSGYDLNTLFFIFWTKNEEGNLYKLSKVLRFSEYEIEDKDNNLSEVAKMVKIFSVSVWELYQASRSKLTMFWYFLYKGILTDQLDINKLPWYVRPLAYVLQRNPFLRRKFLELAQNYFG